MEPKAKRGRPARIEGFALFCRVEEWKAHLALSRGGWFRRVQWKLLESTRSDVLKEIARGNCPAPLLSVLSKLIEHDDREQRRLGTTTRAWAKTAKERPSPLVRAEGPIRPRSVKQALRRWRLKASTPSEFRKSID